MTESNTTPLIIDDGDGSQYTMLANPNFDIKAITISNGIVSP